MGNQTLTASKLNIRSAGDLYQRKVCVVGLGISGRAAAQLLLDHGADVVATDANPDLESMADVKALRSQGAKIQLGPGETTGFQGAEAIILSPGIPHDQPALDAARLRGISVMGEMELAARLIQTPMVAVTGTNGKTTTTELISAMLAAGGQRVVTGGNIGRPLSQCIEEARNAQWLVVEVSSFQLDTMETFHPRVAVLLNIAQDHMDRYPDFDAYCASKARILINQGAGDTAVVYGADPRIAGICSHRPLDLQIFGHGDEPNLFNQPLAAQITSDCIEMDTASARDAALGLSGIALLGRHNRENIAAAALATLAAGGSLEGIRQALSQFKAAPHRMEVVADIEEVTFINDSKATNPNAVQKALASFERPVVLIMGGRDKEMDFSTLKGPIQERVKSLILMGETREKLQELLGGLVPTQSTETLEKAVEMACNNAQSGDVVLLSPACTSFDQYANYQARGDDFRRLVKRIQARG